MSLSELASKYINSAEHVFSHMEVVETPIKPDIHEVSNVVDFAKAYLDDAKYYREKKKFGVSLTSIAYCEGLLDGLRLLGAVRFDWPRRKEETKQSGR
jgi:diphthine synthase